MAKQKLTFQQTLTFHITAQCEVYYYKDCYGSTITFPVSVGFSQKTAVSVFPVSVFT